MASTNSLSCLFFVIIGIYAANGMDCTLGTSKNIVDQFINSCPRPLVDSQDEQYCCWTASGDSVHCCKLTDFIFNSISLALPIIIICLVVSFIVSCICCLCCPCCCIYKRRSGGRVFRQGSTAVVTVGPYAFPPTTPYSLVSDGRQYAVA